MMRTPKTVAGFGIRLVAFYAVLAAPWPKLPALYSRGFATCCDYLTYGVFNGYGMFGTNATARVYPVSEPDSSHDIMIIVGNRRTRAATDSPRTSSRHLGYVPAMVLVCLVLATPVPWPRRVSGLAWGLLWIHCFVVIRVALLLAYAFHGTHPYNTYFLGPFWGKALFVAYDVAAVEPVISYVVPVLVWIVTLFRRSDLRGFGLPESAVSGQTGGAENVPDRV